MELWGPDQIALSHTSKELMSDVQETARRVRDYRPLPPPVVKRIEEELVGERVYNSNAIEGNTLSLRETIMILKQGIASGGRKREAMEARNLGLAVNRITEYVDNREDCYTGDKLKEIHGIILNEINDEWAGQFCRDRVMIQGVPHQPPDHSLVPSMVEMAMEKLVNASEVEPLLRATWIHWAISRIHPFYDGNGRMARLWQDLVLLQSELTCAIIRPTDRRQYLDALTEADEGDFNALVQLIAQRVSSTFDKYLTEITQEHELEDWVKQLAGEADSRVQERKELSYARWARKMEQLRWEFELCASRITDASSNVKVQVRSFDLIDRSRWETIASGARAERTWFFVAEFSSKTTKRLYYFFFGKHYWSELDNQQDRAENRVCLLISEDDGSDQGVRLDQMDGCPIILREVFLVGDDFVVKEENPATSELEYKRNVPPLKIAQDFMRDVILKRLTP